MIFKPSLQYQFLPPTPNLTICRHLSQLYGANLTQWHLPGASPLVSPTKQKQRQSHPSKMFCWIEKKKEKKETKRERKKRERGQATAASSISRYIEYSV